MNRIGLLGCGRTAETHTMATMSTGLIGLDQALQGLLPGDNVVWQVESVQDYKPFLRPFWTEAKREERKLIYFRFARHEALLSAAEGAMVHELKPEEGFERFVTEILDVITEAGPGAFYIFDCLSDLAADWFSDRMLGNFFMITCPFLYRLETITYFALLKGRHSFHATDGIFNTAQVVLEVFRKDQRIFIHPQKVYERHSPTLYMLHRWEGEEFQPVTSSAIVTDILGSMPQPWLEFTIHRPGVWTTYFRQAEETLACVRQGTIPPEQGEACFERLLNMLATRDPRFLVLARKYFTLDDLVAIMQRMIGTGLIGGKSLGMLLARAILRKTDPRWERLLEAHDSFFIGSDVYYTYLVQNGCWWLRHRQKDFGLYLERAEEARQKILTGTFPDYIQKQFTEMLEYFGQSPLIVRSSSLLEDNYGNAFSGKYESVFCANQGTPRQRLDEFMKAVRTVYASTLSREGLEYRRHRGLLERDEQMALLVQRVSGEMYGRYYFPQVAGVGFSFNPFAWHEDIDPRAGVLRLVFGLGTRAVDRTEDDYARLVALNAPMKRPESREEIREFSQRRVDVLDLKANQWATRHFESVARGLPQPTLEFFGACDEELQNRLRGRSVADTFPWMLSLDRLLSETDFARDMHQLLRILEEAYGGPVDIEFTTNFLPDGRYRINLLQCRPFQVKIKGEGRRAQYPEEVPPSRILLQSHGPIVGHGLSMTIHRLIYVVPSVYGRMTLTQRYSVARTIGRITHLEGAQASGPIMLIGPGRWGTSMPSLGVPVQFAEINTVSVLCELALMHEGLVPDISLGTHFFNDLVEMDMLYFAISPEKTGHLFNDALIRQQPNRLPELLPGAAEWAEAIWVVDAPPNGAGHKIYLNVDSVKQRAICYQES